MNTETEREHDCQVASDLLAAHGFSDDLVGLVRNLSVWRVTMDYDLNYDGRSQEVGLYTSLESAKKAGEAHLRKEYGTKRKLEWVELRPNSHELPLSSRGVSVYAYLTKIEQ